MSAHKRLVVVDRDSDHRGVHYWMSGKPEGETVQKLQHILQIRQKAEFDILVRMQKRQRHNNEKKRQTEKKKCFVNQIRHKWLIIDTNWEVDSLLLGN